MVRTEASALHRGRGGGLVGIIDVAADPVGAALLREHCSGPRLAAVLAEREHWQAGEVVAALHPVVAALERLHGRGVAHSALDAGEIILTAAGGVLGDLGRAELFEPESPEAVLARLDAVGRDRHAVRALTADLLRRVTGSRSHAAHSLADAVEQAPAFRLLPDLGLGLEELAAPLHLERGDPLVAPASAPLAPQQATRLMPVVREAEEPTAGIPAAPAPERHGWREAVRTGARGLRARLDALPAGRRRLVVGAGAAVTAAALLLALPRPDAEPASSSPPPGPVVWTAGAEPTGTSGLSEPSTGEAAAIAAIGGDDPVAAAVALLERRQTCFAELSLLCLEEVDQQGSAALIADRAAMEALRAGAEADVTAGDGVDPRLTERWGDSVLVEVGPETAPAPLLLMRSEAGWRIRDWVAGSPD